MTKSWAFSEISRDMTEHKEHELLFSSSEGTDGVGIGRGTTLGLRPQKPGGCRRESLEPCKSAEKATVQGFKVRRVHFYCKRHAFAWRLHESLQILRFAGTLER
jgi:hypothetical protein